MSDTKTQSIDSLDTDVVDSDFHTTESEDDLYPYLEAPFDEMLHVDDSYFGQFYPSAGYVTPVDTGRAEMDQIRSADDVREAMELLGTDVSVITPGLNLRLGMVHHDDLAAAFATAYNEWALDAILDDADDVYGTVVVAPQKPEQAAAEIDRRADEKSVVGVTIPSGGMTPPAGHERYFPIYEAAERASLPVLLHNAGTGLMANFPHQWQWTDRYIDVHVPYHAAEHMFHLSTLLTNAVPVRYPDLEFVVQEAGIGWIPYFVHRYDNEYSEKREDAPMLEKTPSEYVRDQFYFTSQPLEGTDDPRYVCNTIRAFGGEESLMFSSDYPHFDFDFTDQLLQLLRREFSTDAIENIYGGTAKAVYGI